MPPRTEGPAVAGPSGGTGVGAGALLQGYLLQLTSTRAFTLFTLALASGMALVMVGSGVAWAPVVPVALYGAALWYAQRRCYVELGGALQDSPYFLGFLLTLFALFDIFQGLAAPPAGALPVGVVVGKAGGAVLATVAGLFLRQLLIAADPGESAREAVFQSLAREIREQTLAFHESQRRFVALVGEFAEAHERMLSREEVAFTRYVERLEAASGDLGRLQAEYPEHVDALLGALDTAAGRLAQVNERAEEELERLHAATQERIETERANDAARLHAASATLARAREAAEAEINKLLEATGSGLPRLTTTLQAAERSIAAYGAAAARNADALEQTAQAVAAARSGLEALGRDAARSGAALVQAAGETGEELRARFEERLHAAHADLVAIDAILDELARVLRERLAPAGEAP